MKSIIIQEHQKTSTVENIDDIQIGQWYWVKRDNNDWLGCVMRIGSNYVKIHSPQQDRSCHTIRVHFDEFFEVLKYEPDASKIIESKTRHYQGKVKQLLDEVKNITGKLGMSPLTAIDDKLANKETNALAVLSGQGNIKEYENSLIHAKDKLLPELFEAIKHNNIKVAKWMGAASLPLQAMIKNMDGVMANIKDRVFNVSLYAGLTEQVTQCINGEPADFTEKLHVMQRRLYMDEECLLNYQHGGMDFKSIEKYDEWLCKPVNRDRIMPFPRCMVAMKVRRLAKERESDGTLSTAFINIRLEALDELTFLYIRNGEQIYRMNCDLDFGEFIFPDKASFDPGEEKMVKMFCNRIDKIITKHDYEERIKKERLRKKQEKNWLKDNPYEEWKKDKKESEQSEGRWKFVNPYNQVHHSRFEPNSWEPFNPSSVYYDDVKKILTDEIKQYNRIALIIQGLFDRSPVLHPHPPLKIWTNEGFNASVKLVYDGENALYGGEKPDFEAYRQKCNQSIDANSMLIGQELYWMKKEAEKENERESRNWRVRNKSHYELFTPYGNPGPGYLVKPVKWIRNSRRAVFEWKRERLTNIFYDNSPIRCILTVPEEYLFNVSAYRIGDYKQFFQDPRTRAEYLKWAPMLLTAEEYHAKNK